MLIDPETLEIDLAKLEDIEKASLRLVVQALCDYLDDAIKIFRYESDLVADIGEDITREALDKLGMSRIDRRLFGKIDYKRARYVFHPDYSVKQALFVDSKAEKVSGKHTATLQTSQFSMTVRQIRGGRPIEVKGTLPKIVRIYDEKYITTTIFVKYNYVENELGKKELHSITVAALPNGFLQERYNPTPKDGIWLVGRNAPSRGEAFRVRLSFPRLKSKCNWRVQDIPVPPGVYNWED